MEYSIVALIHFAGFNCFLFLFFLAKTYSNCSTRIYVMCLETFIVLDWLPDFPFSVALNHIDLCCGTAGARVTTAIHRLRIVVCSFSPLGSSFLCFHVKSNSKMQLMICIK